MHRFLIGFAIPFAACLGWAIWTHGRFGAAYPAEWAALALTLLVVPILAGLAAVGLVHYRRPRRWLLRGATGRWRAGLLGLLAGLVVIPAIGVAIYYVNRPPPGSREAQWAPDLDMERVNDAVVVAPVCFVFALLGAWLLPQRRAGSCVGCDYDVRYSLDSGRCPECGRAI